MAQNLKARTPLYVGLGLAGMGGYYLYQAGGDPNTAKNKLKDDANKARANIPRGGQAEKIGEKIGAEANANIDETVENARDKARADGVIGNAADDSLNKIDEIRHEAARKMGTSVDKLDRKIEDKAAEAKNNIKGWFGSK
ncbi:hypothetical protein VTN00DRAFT_1585 [Thermoascus crustaceus]|uniref:uncharacterized protein n=1 Tax=Thermoascus crustaceus TaxID=5088 RepID=UPI0037439280